MVKYKDAQGNVVEAPDGTALPEGCTLVEAAPDPAAATPPAVVPPAAAPAGTTVNVDGKTVILPTHAFSRLKKEEREKGRKEAAELLAKEHGFATVEEMQVALKAKPAKVVAPAVDLPVVEETPDPVDPTVPAGLTPKARTAWLAERSRLRDEAEGLKRSVAAAERRAAQEKQSRQDLETRVTLERAATKVGVQDVDYAITLLTRHVNDLPEEQLKTFDPEKFFVELKPTKPFLFVEATPVPATTGSAAGAPKPPTPEKVAGATGANGRVDARTMSRAEYNDLLKKRGLNPNSA